MKNGLIVDSTFAKVAVLIQWFANQVALRQAALAKRVTVEL
jgi:hypothetical protein